LLFGCSNQTIGAHNSPPQATITSPSANAQLEETTVIFAGTVRDSEDPADSLTVRWYDNETPDEPMCEGAPDSTGYTTCAGVALTQGTHLITLQVTDSKGASDEANIEVDVLLGTDPPEVVINSPLSGVTYYQSDIVGFAGHVQSADGLEFDLQIVWNSDIQGDLFAGYADSAGDTSFETPLTTGTHIITLRATDSLGAQGQDSTAIIVSPYPPGQLDLDGDGYCPDGIDNAPSDGHCLDAELTGVNSQDCDDFDNGTFPGATEVCDGQDNDCDGNIPQNELDSDGDGQAICEGDCDDNDLNNFSNNVEICDGADNDCNTLADMDLAGEIDYDNDGYLSCNDCDDNNSEINPSVAEVCGDGIDNDCDGLSDSGLDLDGDGSPGLPCGDDCNDANPIIFPLAYDDCSDMLDNDCDGNVNDDEADNFESWETSISSTGYQLSGQGPDLSFTTSSCPFDIGLGFPLYVHPGVGSVSGNFSSSDDIDIYEFGTGLSGQFVGWWNLIASGGATAPTGCDQGNISWNSAHPIDVALWVDGQEEASSVGTAVGSLPFTLSVGQIVGVDYRIVVEQTGTWLPTVGGECQPDYTINFEIP
jgi:hypothetical protein